MPPILNEDVYKIRQKQDLSEGHDLTHYKKEPIWEVSDRTDASKPKHFPLSVTVVEVRGGMGKSHSGTQREWSALVA